MTAKRNNQNKRLIYGTPLPLPCLYTQSTSATPSGSAAVASVVVTKPPCREHWTPLDPILDGIRCLYRWSRESYSHRVPGRTRSDQKNKKRLVPAEFHKHGESVWVLGSQDMAQLFQQGFFGKGTLSRSEATWRQRNAKDAQGVSLEDITRQRRIERAQLKKEKAQGKASGSVPATINMATGTDTGSQASPLIPASASSSAMPSPLLSAASNDTTKALLKNSISTPPSSATVAMMAQTMILIPQRETDPELDYEHLQLSLEEAFFLVFAIEVIEVTDPSESCEHKAVLSIQDCWLMFAQAAVARSPIAKNISLPEFRLAPDNPFIVRYVVYHYFRSQGWVVKDGLKYGADFMLYRKGMVFGHSQYGVRVIPCHDLGTLSKNQESEGPSAFSMQTIQPVMSPTPGSSMSHPVHSWQWLLSLNRIISQVQKTTLVCHVVLPQNITPQQLSHPRTALPLYNVVEFGIKRFLPERNRA